MKPKHNLLAAPGIIPAALIAELDRVIAGLMERRNEIARTSPFQPELIQIVTLPRMDKVAEGRLDSVS